MPKAWQIAYLSLKVEDQWHMLLVERQKESGDWKEEEGVWGFSEDKELNRRASLMQR